MRALMIALALLIASAAAFATNLPDPAVFVNPNYSNTTTIVTWNGVTYRGPSQFTYVGECVKPDGPRYRCDIRREDGVVLYNADQTQHVTVSLIVQFSSTLITSGHNWWRATDTVLSGVVH